MYLKNSMCYPNENVGGLYRGGGGGGGGCCCSYNTEMKPFSLTAKKIRGQVCGIFDCAIIFRKLQCYQACIEETKRTTDL